MTAKDFSCPPDTRGFVAWTRGANDFYEGRPRPSTFDYHGYFQYLGYDTPHQPGVGPEQIARARGWDFAENMNRLKLNYLQRVAA